MHVSSLDFACRLLGVVYPLTLATAVWLTLYVHDVHRLRMTIRGLLVLMTLLALGLVISQAMLAQWPADRW